ncbi:MAG: sugar phosphate nucleotidyltransferase [Pseudoflavonifractor sp.]|nr:sugar phosphate nucleotidyltransferase [Alloprevotella sp.]MCM1116255.1 sugar phosphate nucleotidyltransferase [Pseudoflavonifractor sp.]
MIKGMIFAAGLGSRLRPLTDKVPKAMIEVGGRPMLRRIIDKMASAGAEEIVVNVCHLGHIIKEWVEREELPAKVIVSDESGALLETGGGLLKAEPLLADAEMIMLHNADILSDASLALMAEWHRWSGAMATLLVDPLRSSSRRLLLDEERRVRGRINLSTGVVTPTGLDPDGLTRAAFGGIHIVSPKIFELLREYAKATGEEKFSIMDFYLAKATEMRVMGYVAEHPSMWFDIGRPESLAAARGAL